MNVINRTEDYNPFGILRLISVVGWIALRGFDLLFYCIHMLVISPLYPERLLIIFSYQRLHSAYYEISIYCTGI